MTRAINMPRASNRRRGAMRTLPACSPVRACRAALLFLGCALGSIQVLAAGWASFPVDDSLSHVQAPSAQLRWRHTLPSTGTENLLDAVTSVRIVLNVNAWVGMPARIYMVMPPLPQSSLSIQWTTGGTLLPGRLSGGQRQLVFQGVIPGPRIEDAMSVAVGADARDPFTPQRVNFTFEIEVPSP